MIESKPFSLQDPEYLVKRYGADKHAIGVAMQQGLIDPTAATLAGMRIDYMLRNAAAAQSAPQTVVEETFNPQPQQMQQPQQAQQPQGMPGGQPPMQQPMQQPPQMAASGGLLGVPIPDNMYGSGNYAGGGVVAFATGNSVKSRRDPKIIRQEMDDALRVRDIYAVKELEVELAAAEAPATQSSMNLLGSSDDWGRVMGQVKQRMKPTPSEGFHDPEAQFQDNFVSPPVNARSQEAERGAQRAKLTPAEEARFLAQVDKEDMQDVRRAPQTSTRPFDPNFIYGVHKQRGLGDLAASTAQNTSTTGGVGRTEIGDFVAPTKEERKNMTLEEQIALYKGQLDKIPGSSLSPEELAKRKKQDWWMTLAQAGFGTAAGSSPYGFQNIGAGFQGAMPYAADAMKELRALEQDAAKEKASLGLAALDMGSKADAAENSAIDAANESYLDRFARAREQYEQNRITVSEGYEGRKSARENSALATISAERQRLIDYAKIAQARATGTMTPELEALDAAYNRDTTESDNRYRMVASGREATTYQRYVEMAAEEIKGFGAVAKPYRERIKNGEDPAAVIQELAMELARKDGASTGAGGASGGRNISVDY